MKEAKIKRIFLLLENLLTYFKKDTLLNDIVFVESVQRNTVENR